MIGLLCGVLSMFGLACHQPVEHVVHDGDRVDIPATDILTIRWDGADPTDEAHYTLLCEDMGGTFMVRAFGPDITATCFNVDH